MGFIALAREQEERKDSELAVSALKRQLAILKERTEAVEGEIEQLRASTSNLRRGSPIVSHQSSPPLTGMPITTTVMPRP